MNASALAVYLRDARTPDEVVRAFWDAYHPCECEDVRCPGWAYEADQLVSVLRERGMLSEVSA